MIMLLRCTAIFEYNRDRLVESVGLLAQLIIITYFIIICEKDLVFRLVSTNNELYCFNITSYIVCYKYLPTFERTYFEICWKDFS